VSFRTAGLALVQLGSLVAVGWIVAETSARKWLREPSTTYIGLPERALGAVCGFVAFSCVLMVLHIVLGGVMFGVGGVVPTIAIAVILFDALRRRSRPPGQGRIYRELSLKKALMLSMGVMLLSLLFILPVLRGGTSVRTGDTPWHLGWSEQLLDGEAVPTGPAPEFGRNAYPWGFHAVVATLVRLVPGSDPLIAHETLHFLFVFAIPLAAACLARIINRRAGPAGAGAMALIGGFGWITAGGPDFILSPSLARYGADLVVASPNSMYELFPPALPRELGLVLLAAGGVVLALVARKPTRRHAAAAGVLFGLAGLISVPIFVMALVWIVCAALTMPKGSRIEVLVTAVIAAIVVFGVWLGPVLANFIRYGGFVNITPQLGVEWPVVTALWSWGVLFPLALIGLVAATRAWKPEAKMVFILAVGTSALLLISIARGFYDWSLAGNATLLHQGRVWPVAHLLGAAFAGVALIALWDWFARRSRLVAFAATSGVLALGAVSPALASIHLTESIEIHYAGYLYTRPDFDSGAFVRRAAEHLNSSDVVLVHESDFLGFLLFSFTGARLANYDDARLAHNDLRIRYEDLARAWDERIASEGFSPDFEVMPAAMAPAGVEPVVSGSFRDEDWILIRYPD
jgi:hypothetical protein